MCCSLATCKISHFHIIDYDTPGHALGSQNPWTCGFVSSSYGEYCYFWQDIDPVRFKTPGPSLAPMVCGFKVRYVSAVPLGSVLHEWHPVPLGVWVLWSVLKVVGMLLRARALHRTKTSPSICTQLCRLLVKAYSPCDLPITFQFSWSLLASPYAHYLWLQPCLGWKRMGAKEKHSRLPHWFGGLSRPGFHHRSSATIPLMDAPWWERQAGLCLLNRNLEPVSTQL